MRQQAKNSPKDYTGRKHVLAVAAGATGTRDDPYILAIDCRYEMNVVGKITTLRHSLAILRMNHSADRQGSMFNQHMAVALDVLLDAKIDRRVSLGIGRADRLLQFQFDDCS